MKIFRTDGEKIIAQCRAYIENIHGDAGGFLNDLDASVREAKDMAEAAMDVPSQVQIDDDE